MFKIVIKWIKFIYFVATKYLLFKVVNTFVNIASKKQFNVFLDILNNNKLKKMTSI